MKKASDEGALANPATLGAGGDILSGISELWFGMLTKQGLFRASQNYIAFKQADNPFADQWRAQPA